MDQSEVDEYKPFITSVKSHNGYTVSLMVFDRYRERYEVRETFGWGMTKEEADKWAAEIANTRGLEVR